MVQCRGLLALVGLASLGLVFAAEDKPKFAGCNSTDVAKIGALGRSMMPCVGVSIADALGFLGSLSDQQTTWMNACSESVNDNFGKCLLLVESISKMVVSNPGSLPNKVAIKVYNQPQTVLTCISKLASSSNANGYSLTCKDGAVIKRALKAAIRLNSYLAPIQPWAWPSLVKGCQVTDLVQLELAVLPTIECMNIDFSKLSKAFTGNTPKDPSSINQVEDATYKAGIGCAYNPHISNADCVYLMNLASQTASKMSGNRLTQSGNLLDVDKMCRCAAGMSQSAAARAIPATCAASDAVNFLVAAEEICKRSKAVKKTMGSGLIGCDDGDMSNVGLLALEALDCVKGDGKAVLGSSKVLDENRMNELALCAAQAGFNNPHCMGLLSSLPGIVASQPNSLEALLVKEMGAADNTAFCTCMDTVGKSIPAQNISPSCSAPTSVTAFLRGNKATCLALAGKPASTWPSIVSSVSAVKV